MHRRSALVLSVLLGVAGRTRAAEPPTLTVFAAASLKEIFTALVPAFEREHPGSKVRFSFAGTQELRLQIEHGAAADLIAAADTKHVAALVAAGLALPGVPFARNQLVVIVPPANPAHLGAFADLPRAARLVVGTPEVPIGAYTAQVLDRAATQLKGFRAAVEAKVVSRELNVKQIVAKVALGEADAGVVYETDARAAAGKVTALPVPPAYNVLAEYPVALLTNARHNALAEDWVKLLRGPAGQQLLREAGFRLPEQAR
jgi:molybdate transport system substrate-binding protein